MTDAKVLLELADRCEKASGPDRELDAEIRAMLSGGVKPRLNGSMLKQYEYDEAMGGAPVRRSVFAYSASIDAALTLVPDGGNWSFDGEVMCVTLPTGRFLVSSDVEAYGTNKGTPALALCAAALFARAHLSAQRPSTPSSDHPNP